MALLEAKMSLTWEADKAPRSEATPTWGKSHGGELPKGKLKGT